MFRFFSLSLTSCLSAEHISIVLLSRVKCVNMEVQVNAESIQLSVTEQCRACPGAGPVPVRAGPVKAPGLSRRRACPGAGPVQALGLSRCSGRVKTCRDES